MNPANNDGGNSSAPEGLDDFLAAEDPKAAAAAQGFQQVGALPVVQQALDVGNNLDQQNAMVQAAIAGDPNARLALAQHSLGTAMGSLHAVGTTEGMLPVMAKEATPLEKATQIRNAFGEVDPNSVSTARSVDNYSRLVDRAAQAKAATRSKRYAGGGEVGDDTSNLAADSGSPSAKEPAGLNDFINEDLQQAKYGTAGQQAIAGLEAGAQGIAGPLAPLAEKALGVKEEDIRGRAEANPVTHYGSEIAGLGAGLLTGAGEGAIAAKAGEAVAGLAGLGGELTALSKIGSTATKAAIENMTIQGSDELSKLVLHDPNQSVETAITDVGLSGLLGGGIGGAIGAVNPLWHATMGSKLGGVLKGISDRAGGIDGVVPDAVHEAIQTSGINVAPEVKAALSSDPEIRQMFQTLQESSTGSGQAAQEALGTFRKDAADAVVKSLGKMPEEVAGLSDLSENEAGTALKKTLKDSLKESIDPISAKFDGIKERFKSTELPQLAKDDIATKIAEMSNENGYNLSPSSPPAKIVNRVLEELPNLKTLEDVRKYGSVVGDTTSNPELWRVGSQIKKILRAAEESTLETHLGAEAPELLAEHAEARKAYASAMNTIDSLNDRLHVGRYSGPSSFIKALSDMSPEDVLRRLSPKGDAGIIGELSEKFPNVAQQLRQFHLDQALKTAASRASPGETINSKVLFSTLEKMSPEMRNFVIPNEMQPKIEAIRSLIEGLPAKMNNSGTAKTLDALWGHLPGSAIAMATLLSGHNPAASFLLGGLAKWIGRDAPDAIRLSMLKFLGSNQPIESQAFKSMVDGIHSMVKGESLISKASTNLFKAGREVLPQSAIPSDADRTKLDKKLKGLQVDAQPLLGVGGDIAHYMPDHGQAMGQVAATAVNYLNGLRPNQDKLSPLDTKMPPSPAQKAAFDRALDIAQQPLLVLDKVKKGTVTPQDLQALNTMYPNLYKRLAQKLTADMTNHIAKGDTVPYQTRIGLSMFLGQPLDSTMTPSAIMSAQAASLSSPHNQAPQNGNPQQTKHSTASLNKISSMYRTPSQASQENKLKP